MTLNQEFLDKLVCPICKGPLQYEPERERLICNACRLAYRITDDIPVLLADEAEKLKEGAE
jgi:uncharacterized protein YbaR (Trm112 family)